MSTSIFDVFSNREADVIGRPELHQLILHLHNPKAWPMADMEQYLAGLSDASRGVAHEIIKTYKGDPDFKAHAAALEIATRNTERDYSDTEPDDY